MAQTSETIVSSRPGQAVVPNTTGKNFLQWQTGFNFGGISSDNFADLKRRSFDYSGVIRYGFIEKMEFRTSYAYSSRARILDGDKTSAGDISLLSFGTRYNLVNNDFGALGVQVDVALPNIGTEFASDKLSPNVMLIYSNPLGDLFTLTTNWGISWPGFDDTEPYGIYVINLAFPLSRKVGSFIENYGTIFNGVYNYWDTGLSFLVNNDLQLDAGIGFAKNEGVESWFVDAGLSWRVKL